MIIKLKSCVMSTYWDKDECYVEITKLTNLKEGKTESLHFKIYERGSNNLSLLLDYAQTILSEHFDEKDWLEIYNTIIDIVKKETHQKL